MDWSNVAALHVMVKMSPTNAPVEGVRMFVLSGNQFLYSSVFDDTKFKTGGWNEMTLQLVGGSYYDPTKVFRIGAEVRLDPARGIPPGPYKVDVWLDDVWLEPK
jgi:hypothetical protein